MKALVIDDSRAMRSLLGRILRGAGFEVIEACDGREGLECLRQQRGVQPFDVALVDWNMPVMGGQEFVIAVRSDRAFRDLRVLMVTTESELAKVQAALEAGADEYAMKPFTEEVILEKLAILGILEP